MTNALVEDFMNTTSRLRFLWKDDPKGFIANYLKTDDESLRTNRSKALWENARTGERNEALRLLSLIEKEFPVRGSKQLIYTLAFVPTFGANAHITLLGPTLFPSKNDLTRYIKQANAIIEKVKTIKACVSSDVKLHRPDRPTMTLHTVKPTEELQHIHNSLVSAAIMNNANLLEEEFTGNNFLPHITHSESCKIKEGDKFIIEQVTFSLHPRAELNVKEAIEYSSVKLLSE